MLRVWAAFTAILGIMWPMGFGLDTPANVPLSSVWISTFRGMGETGCVGQARQEH